MIFSNNVESVKKIGILKPFPYYPSCIYTLVESVSHYMFGIANFNKSYPWHSFLYEKELDKMGHKDDIQLNILLDRKIGGEINFRDNRDKSLIAGRIHDYYGVNIDRIPFNNIETAKSYIYASLNEGIPVICSYSLGYVPGNRCYKKIFGWHSISIVGYDSQRKVLLAMHGALSQEFEITELDFSLCFNFLVSEYEFFTVLNLTRDSEKEKNISLDDILNVSKTNITNLQCTEKNNGLTGLYNFYRELEEYIQTRPEKPIFIPGSWVFSHERISLSKWLTTINEEMYFDELNLAVDKLIEHSNVLSKRWLSLDFLCELGINTNSSNFNLSILNKLKDIYELENQSINLWKNIHDIARLSHFNHSTRRIRSNLQPKGDLKCSTD